MERIKLQDAVKEINAHAHGKFVEFSVGRCFNQIKMTSVFVRDIEIVSEKDISSEESDKTTYRTYVETLLITLFQAPGQVIRCDRRLYTEQMRGRYTIKLLTGQQFAIVTCFQA